MRKSFFIYILDIVITAILTVGCQQPQMKQATNPDDIANHYQRVLTAANESPDSAMLMVEKLRAGVSAGISLNTKGLIPDYHADLMRAKIYTQSQDSMLLDSAIIIGERLMALDVMQTNLATRQDVLEMLISACRLHRDDEQTIHWSMQLIDLCRQQGEETEALRTEAEVGLVLSYIGKADEGLAKIDSVINQLSGKRKFNEMDASIIALRRKENLLASERRYGEIPPVAQALLNILDDYEQHPDEFHDGSYREVKEEQRPDYIEFYRAKAYMYMAYAYAKASPREGLDGAARHYLRLFEQCAFAKTLEGRLEIAPTWCLLGEYDKMSAAYDEYENRLREQGDTMTNTYANILRDRAQAAKAQGRYAESLRLHEQYETLTETLNGRLLQGKAHLYAARFHAAEHQQEIEKQKADKRFITMMAFFIGILAMLGLFFAWYADRQWHKTQLKNCVLAQQIKEAMMYKEKYERLTNAPSFPNGTRLPEDYPKERDEYTSEDEKPSASSNNYSPPIPETSTKRPSTYEAQESSPSRRISQRGAGDGSLDSLSPEELFHYIEHEVSRRLLFLNPSFDRQAIIDEFHISKERVGAAFSQGSKYDSMTQFVNDLRLEYASKLLVTTDLSISDIMTKAGFSNASVFSRYFSRKYQITPTQYRRANSE